MNIVAIPSIDESMGFLATLFIEKIKKDNDVQTYKEIVAFSEGKLLDDIHKQQEIGKRPYQKMLLVIGSVLITLCVCMLIGLLMHMFFN